MSDPTGPDFDRPNTPAGWGDQSAGNFGDALQPPAAPHTPPQAAPYGAPMPHAPQTTAYPGSMPIGYGGYSPDSRSTRPRSGKPVGLLCLAVSLLFVVASVFTFMAVSSMPLDQLEQELASDPQTQQEMQQLGWDAGDVRGIMAGGFSVCGALPALPLLILSPFVLARKRPALITSVVVACVALLFGGTAMFMSLVGFEGDGSWTVVALLTWLVTGILNIIYIVMAIVAASKDNGVHDQAQQQAAWQAYHAQQYYYQQMQQQMPGGNPPPQS